jgi:hypothetical protein
MKNAIALLLVLTALLLSTTAGIADTSADRLHLADGSILQGTVLSLDDTVLQFTTSYGGDMSIPREQILVIQLNGADLPAAPTQAPVDGAPVTTTPAPTGEGVLEVALKGDGPRSSTRFRKPQDRDRVLSMNTLYFKIYVDGELVFQDSDGSIEKEFSDSGWTNLRNSHHFSPAEIVLSAGPHRVLVVVGNELDLLEEGERQSGMISAELMVEEIIVRDGEKTRLAIEGDGARFSYGKYKLKLLSRH